jgi:hypothetical protein
MPRRIGRRDQRRRFRLAGNLPIPDGSAQTAAPVTAESPAQVTAGRQEARRLAPSSFLRKQLKPGRLVVLVCSGRGAGALSLPVG